jgi:hypothetical protein
MWTSRSSGGSRRAAATARTAGQRQAQQPAERDAAQERPPGDRLRLRPHRAGRPLPAGLQRGADDETAATTAAWWQRAIAWFAEQGVRIERVLTDNGPVLPLGLWLEVCTQHGIAAKRTRAYRPQTNGKVERFHRTLLVEWAYVRIYTSDRARTTALRKWLHLYNHHRTHTRSGASRQPRHQPLGSVHLGGARARLDPTSRARATPAGSAARRRASCRRRGPGRPRSGPAAARTACARRRRSGSRSARGPSRCCRRRRGTASRR